MISLIPKESPCMHLGLSRFESYSGLMIYFADEL